MRPSRTVPITAVLTIVAVACALGSPFVLAVIDRWWRPDWRHLADIGQAYGTASAVFSALAVAGVSASLLYQGRQLRLAQVQAVRSTHRELLARAMEDPEVYAPAAGFRGWQMLPKQHWFLTNYVNYLFMSYETGVANEDGLRHEALAALFSGALGRRWWAMAGSDWHRTSSAAQKEFATIVEDEYQKAIAAGPPLELSAFLGEQPARRRQPYPEFVAAATLAALVGWLVGRRRR